MPRQRPTRRTPHELPRTVTPDGRRLTVRLLRPADREDLVSMYARFGECDRAQGVPPAGEAAIDDWLDGLLDGEHVVAVSRGRLVGHAGLLPCGDCAELLVFVDPRSRGVGVGTRLLRSLLARHDRREAGTVRLSVERDNEAAIALYRTFDFEICSRQRRELVMERRG
ncbi:MAG: N-acetyltransferase family protein [Haloferacaceae archaeon]